MKTTRVTIAAGATATPILATIPAQFVRIVEDVANPAETLVVQIVQPTNNTFSDEVTYKPGDPITIHRSNGIIARPPNYSASGQPATGEAYCKIRTASAGATAVRVIEHENLPLGNY